MSDPKFVVAEPVRTIHPEALLRIDVVREITGLSASAIWMEQLPDAEIRPATARSQA